MSEPTDKTLLIASMSLGNGFVLQAQLRGSESSGRHIGYRLVGESPDIDREAKKVIIGSDHAIALALIARR
jgi:hypothetical protein